MKKLISVLSGLALVAAIGTAHAGDKGSVTGVLKESNTADHTIVLEDGTKLRLADGVSLRKIRLGMEVTVSYEMKGDEKIGTGIESDDVRDGDN